MRRVGPALVSFLLLVGFAAAGVAARQSATPTPTYSAATTIFAQAAPFPVADPELSLAFLTIPPGVALPVHQHPGTQLATIVAGHLTYTVHTGGILLRRAGTAPDAPPTLIRPDQTVLLGPGDSVIEQPGSYHVGRNEGTEPIELWTATLFPAGAARADVVEITPSP